MIFSNTNQKYSIKQTKCTMTDIFKNSGLGNLNEKRSICAQIALRLIEGEDKRRLRGAKFNKFYF